MSTFNKKANVAQSLLNHPQATVNHGGGLGYTTSLETELYRLVSTSFLEDKFYETKNEQITRLSGLVSKVPFDFVLSLANYARNKLNLRSVSVLLLVLAAERQHKEKFGVSRQKSVESYVEKVVQRADEVAESIAVHIGLTGAKKGLPNSLRKGLRVRLTKFSKNQLLKYQGTAKSVKLRDAIKLLHPKPKDDAQAGLFKQIIEGSAEAAKTWETKISKDGSTKENWDAAAKDMGFMALLRNARNAEQKGANELLEKIVTAMNDPEQVRKSRQLPFRFLSAERNVTSQRLKDAFRIALQHSLENLPRFAGKTAIFIDVSGSMSGNVSQESQLGYKDIAHLFGAMLLNRTDDAFIGVYSSDFRPIQLSRLDSVLTNLHNIEKHFIGGGTEAYKALAHINKNKMDFDRIVFVGDEQVYGGGYAGSFQTEWKKYRNTHPETRLYTINLAGYKATMLPESEPGVYQFAGWSEQIIGQIDQLENSGQVIDDIKNNW